MKIDGVFCSKMYLFGEGMVQFQKVSYRKGIQATVDGEFGNKK